MLARVRSSRPLVALQLLLAACVQCSFLLQHAGAPHAAQNLPTPARAGRVVAEDVWESPCVIKVVGVGGGGGNAVNRMIQFGQTGSSPVEYWAINTDIQALDASLSPNKLGLGKTTSRGLGAGGNPEMGRKAAEESEEELGRMVTGADMVFVVAGMGGGTGSGAAPCVAEAARAAGALTVGVVTKPFSFEGKRRMSQADGSILKLQQHVDAMIVVSNDRLLELVEENTPLQEAFCVADDILRQGVVGISDLIIKPGLINVDFADIQSVMGNAGLALMGIGTAEGKTRARDAAIAAVSSPLIDFPIEEAKGIVFTITGSSAMTLQEVNTAAACISNLASSDANVIFGAQVDDSMEGVLSVTVVATGFGFD